MKPTTRYLLLWLLFSVLIVTTWAAIDAIERHHHLGVLVAAALFTALPLGLVLAKAGEDLDDAGNGEPR